MGHCTDILYMILHVAKEVDVNSELYSEYTVVYSEYSTVISCYCAESAMGHLIWSSRLLSLPSWRLVCQRTVL